jgi:GTP pyrophosphokinase
MPRFVFAKQLLAWQQEVAASPLQGFIYVLTPQGRIVELPRGATPIDFAYSVHTNLGHRCRGARVDGQLVPLDTGLDNGQTVEIISARGGQPTGPSRDWLNPELGFMHSNRARAKVRQWFSAHELQRDLASGRALVEKIKQREGKTAVSLDDLASRLGFEEPNALFLAMVRNEVGPRAVEEALQSPVQAAASALADADDLPESLQKRVAPPSTAQEVLVVGVDALLTQLASCCKPVPPDAIGGYVTRGRGVSVHRQDCRQFKRLLAVSPDKVLPTDWGRLPTDGKARYAADVALVAHDRPGLLRDVSEVLARAKLNVIAVSTQTKAGVARMAFTVQVPDAHGLQQALNAMREVKGVSDVARYVKR